MKKCGIILIAVMALLVLVFTGCNTDATKDGEKVTITFKNGNTTITTKEVAIDSAIGIANMPSFPTETGKTFSGWKDEENKPFTGVTIVTTALTVTAQWQEVAPLPSSLAIDAVSAVSGGINGTITDLPNSSGLGFVTSIPLTGVTVAEGERLEISFKISGAANFHQVQIAASVDNFAYHTEADPWGNNGYDNEAERSATITATAEAAAELAIKISVKQGFNSVAEGDIVVVTIKDLTVKKLVAAVNRTVTFNPNDGVENAATVTVPDGQKVAAGDIPVFTAPADKAFKYWNTASDGTGTIYVDNNALTALTINADATFYAIWDRVPIVTSLKSTSGNGAITKSALESVYGYANGILVLTVTAPAEGDTQKGGIGGVCIGTSNYSVNPGFSYNSPAGIVNGASHEFKILMSELVAAIDSADGIFVNFYNDYTLTKIDLYTYAEDPNPEFGPQGDGSYKLNPALFTNWYNASIAGNTISFTGGGMNYPFPVDLDISEYSSLVVDYATSGVDYVEGHFLQITVHALKVSGEGYTRDNVNYPTLEYGAGTFTLDNDNFEKLQGEGVVGFDFQVNDSGQETTYSMQINSMTLHP